MFFVEFRPILVLSYLFLDNSEGSSLPILLLPSLFNRHPQQKLPWRVNCQISDSMQMDCYFLIWNDHFFDKLNFLIIKYTNELLHTKIHPQVSTHKIDATNRYSLILLSHSLYIINCSEDQISPNPWLCYSASFMFFIRISLEGYYGSSRTLKQVWAVGRLEILLCLWILNLRALSPSMGTLSVPVTKIMKLFLCSSFKVYKNYQKCLYKRWATWWWEFEGCIHLHRKYSIPAIWYLCLLCRW